MNKIVTVILLVLLLATGMYILILRERCTLLSNQLLSRSIMVTGHIYVHNLNEYKMDHGKYPDTLEALVPDYLDKLYSYDWAYTPEDPDSFDLFINYTNFSKAHNSLSYFSDQHFFTGIHVSEVW